MREENRHFIKGVILLSLLVAEHGVLSLLSAQEIKFKHVSIEDGLSQSTVHSILQDRKGFMWFGTQDGLNRYDGYSFTIFRHDPQDSTSISSSWVQSLLEDRDGRLWAGTNGGGLNLYDAKTKSFRVIKHIPSNASSSSENRIRVIYEDRSGVLWLGTEGGLGICDVKTGAFTYFKNDPGDSKSLSGNFVTSICEDHSGRLWVGTYGAGLNFYDANSKSFVVFKHDQNSPTSLSDDRVRTVCEDRYGALWIGTDEGLNLYDPETKAFRVFKNNPNDPSSLSNNRVRSIYEDHAGQLWVGINGGGLSLYNRATNTFTTSKNDLKNSMSISTNGVYSIYQDHSDRLWVGTYGGGLNLYDTRAKAFRVFKNDPSDPSTLSGNDVASIGLDHDGRLWVGTFGGGLNRYDAKTKTFSVFKNNPKDPRSLSDNVVWSIFADHSGRLWIGTNDGGLNLYDAKTNKFSAFKNDPKNKASLSHNNVTSIFEDHRSNLWIGTFGGGLNLYDEKTKTFRAFKNDPKNSASLSNNRVRSILEDHSGTLWVGTFGGGLNRYDTISKSFTVFKNDPANNSSLSNDVILSICEDHTGRLWIGTFGGGLNLLEMNTGKFKVFNEKRGLPNDVVYGILEDDHGRLWLSTNKGLSRFDPETETFRNYDVSDGLQSNEFSQNTYLKDKDGWMYFGGINGFNMFHPDSIKDDPFVPPIVLTGLDIFNKRVNSDNNDNGFVMPFSVTESDELILSYRELVFTLEFSALIFAQPMKNKYAYRLDGFDKDWNYTDAKRRFATYTNLDPGPYTFRVKGSNHDGVWNDEERTLKIRITPPWWKTWWAFVIYLMIFSGGILGFIRFQINKTKKRGRRLLDKQKVEAQAKSQLAEIENAKKVAVINLELEQTISRLKEAQAQLIQTEKMASLGQMTAGIAHEINNPLSFVHGNLDFFKLEFARILKFAHAVSESAHDDSKRAGLDALGHEVKELVDEMSEQLATTLSGTNRIKDIVENLRKFARVGESGSRETNVNADLEAVIDLFVKQHSGIRIERQFVERLHVAGDASELNQCYLNILTNAIHAIRDSEKQGLLKSGEGIITIRTESVEKDLKKQVRVSLTDNGIGIPDSAKPFVFDPFFTTRPIGQGRGLGLSEAYGIIHRHEGTIEFVSEVGKGTTFIITLPMEFEE